MPIAITRVGQRNLAGDEFALMIEKYTGDVQMKYLKTSIMEGVFDVIPILKGNTASNAQVGDTTLQALVPGERPTVSQIELGDNVVSVKVPLLARTSIGLLDDFQDRLELRQKISGIQGKELGKTYDEITLAKGVEAALTATGKVSSMAGGTVETLGAADDEKDATKLGAGFKKLAQGMDEKEVDDDDRVLYVLPEQYWTLIDNDKLIDADYSAANGDVAKGKLHMASGLRIVKTMRLPAAVIDPHVMGTEYNVTAAMAKCKGLVLRPDAVMVGRTISLQSKVWFDDKDKVWYIDSWYAFGCAVGRPDDAAALFAF